ncbi:MAG: molybdenum cofactor biosynthesis protein MoaE [Anaerovoracaceae bacterium]|nr:molybdenum cofactor biosynthesis protein MoaE [Bacillota bacterium]MDY2670806.1 molybdenum cofactor biosynthesis protein MoaE [Anaerovoracaceae bacterium]
MENEKNTDCSCACVFTPSTELKTPSLDSLLAEAKADSSADQCGMYLFHNGVVRRTAKKQVRQGEESAPVEGMDFSYDREKVEKAMAEATKLPGIHYIRVWLNEGNLNIGDNIMLVLVGGDIRPHVIDALQSLVGEIKNNCVAETEKY